ncbi:MAG TPA: YihY/virulence factor BrkB family protein [Terriglobales bacterium]|nr:YihY/virulence factor BrkB family protein [Terriglobales bacterium]
MAPSPNPAVAAAERIVAPVAEALNTAQKATLRLRGVATLHYLMRTEVHTYAFSVAANAILAFFPFIVLLMTLTRKVFRSETMYDVVVQLLRDFLPTGQDFIVRNLSILVNARKGVQVASLIILLFTSSGVFLPLEVALNRVWGVQKNRSYLGNQIISLVLAFAVGLLTMVSIALTAGNLLLIDAAFADNSVLARSLTSVLTKTFGMTASIAIFFLIYWLLPNAKIPARKVLPAAIATGVLWECAKYVYIFALPWLDFKEVYGPFALSVTLMFWAFISGLLLLGGAHLSADAVDREQHG